MPENVLKLVHSLCALAGCCCLFAPAAMAQTEPELQSGVYAGLTVTGERGMVYSIEYVTDLSNPTENDWRCLDFLQLPASPYLWTDESAPATETRFYRAVAMEQPSGLVFIPPGTFRMGSPTNEVDRLENESPQSQVTISRGFWIGKYEVTQTDYQTVTGNNPSYWTHAPNLPVETVNWSEAVAFCEQRTQIEQAAGQIPANAAYRLPTEAEWEYACRAMTSTRFSYGDDPGYTNLVDYAWHGEFSGNQTHPVGQKLPNLWGLHDVYGNVWEWCHDWYGDYAGGIAVDPRGPGAGSERVIRGGDQNSVAPNCRSAHHRGVSPTTRGRGIGFRVVLAPLWP